MLSDTKAMLLINVGFLLGEMGVTLAIMLVKHEFNPLILFCCLGIWLNINFLITVGFQSYVAEQRRIKDDN